MKLFTNNYFFKKSNVKLSNFGTFSYKLTPERIGRNPKTKKEFIIKEQKNLVFHLQIR